MFNIQFSMKPINQPNNLIINKKQQTNQHTTHQHINTSAHNTLTPNT